MAGFTEEEAKRKTQHPLLPELLLNLTSMNLAGQCAIKIVLSLRVYSHIAPYMGGPEKIMNTNGAGDGALAAAAARYYGEQLPS
ncbi:inosine/guanosine kinase [Salmonella enterica subsp. enterica]|nr:inosine/guanosine kinase [Salmonella enterica subsp. enterica]